MGSRRASARTVSLVASAVVALVAGAWTSYCYAQGLWRLDPDVFVSLEL